MLHLQDNVRQDLIKLVPSSIINEIASFVFYDYHPRDEKNIDIIICTLRGEVKEFFKREVVFSASLDTCSAVTDIKILRNGKCELFYLVAVEGEIIILSRKENLQVHKRIKNVESYDVNDSMCRGQAYLKIIYNDDAVPLLFDDNFESLEDETTKLHQLDVNNSLPIMLDLTRKLTQAKYNVKCYEKAHREIMGLRQNSAFTNYCRMNPNVLDGVYNTKSQEGAITVKSQPWIKICNKKIVLIIEVLNKNSVTVEDVHILMHRTIKSSVVYVTKLYERTSTLPHWREKHSQEIEHNCEVALVVVIDLKELKHSVTSPIEFSGVICYKCQEREYLVALKNVVISAVDTMGEQFCALFTQPDIPYDKIILSIIATSEKTDLHLRHIKADLEPDFELKDLFCKYLKMEQLMSSNNVIVHRSSPYHILHGVMVILQQDDEKAHSDNFSVSLYAKSHSQVLAFIHYIHDTVPRRIIVTTVSQKITAKSSEFTKYNEATINAVPSQHYVDYGESISTQASVMLEYLDSCMIQMNVSKNPVVQLKVGSEIDIFAGGIAEFSGFRKKMLEEAFRGIESTITNSKSCDKGLEGTSTYLDN